ncbi:MAG: hypothetical protein KDA49_13205, partial [Rhodospirillaceae bacterium]|nr:hypothetical protein [Rhodospirillaceae bacterium]
RLDLAAMPRLSSSRQQVMLTDMVPLAPKFVWQERHGNLKMTPDGPEDNCPSRKGEAPLGLVSPLSRLPGRRRANALALCGGSGEAG